jgi:hypothetical protein
MKKKIEYLRLLCPGKLSIQIDDHKRFGETAEQAISTDKTGEYKEITGDVISQMIERDTIIRVECFPPYPIVALSIHWDLDKALESCIQQIEAAKKSFEMQLVVADRGINAN